MLIDKKLLDEVTERARASERLRMNYNLHDSLEAKVQGELSRGHDFAEGVAAFLQKRPAVFTDR